MARVSIRGDKCSELASLVKRLNIELDPFIDPRYYPPPDADPSYVAQYFFFMVAIDHRTGTPSMPFEGYVDGEFYHGADLLYRLGMLKYEEDPDFFSARYMSRITAEGVSSWLSVKEPRHVRVRDPEIRAMLLRDAAHKLLAQYLGNPLSIFKGEPRDWFRALGSFLAYSDPVAKKSFLLIKFLERRHLISMIPAMELHVPVDNHLTRIALRLGIVMPDKEMWHIILSGREVPDEVDVMIRLVVRKAYFLVCEEARIRPTYLDDLLWSLGRTCCTRERPVCVLGCNRVKCTTKRILGSCNGTCPFISACDAFREHKALKIVEHTKLNTWYY